jgi:hypothetical protein
MKKKIFMLSILLLFLLANVANCFSQGCTKDEAKVFEKGFPKLKYCMRNMGWRESVKKYEWGVKVYNMYDDATVRMLFTLVEKGAEASTLSSFTIPPKEDRYYSFYFTSTPDFVWDKIEVIEKDGNKTASEEKTDNKSEQTGNSDYSGEYTKWEGETNKAMSLSIGETEAAVFVKNVGGAAPIIYKTIIPGVYRYDGGQDFMMIKFEGKDRLSLWDNKNLVGYFIRPGSAKNEVIQMPDKDEIFTHAKPIPSAEKMIGVLRNAIDWQHPEKGGKMDFDLTIDDKGTVKGVSVLSNPRNIELEDKVTSHILRQPIVYYHTPAERNGKPVSDNVSYSVTYTSYAEEDKSGISAMNLNGKWKSDIDKNLTVTLTASSEDEFLYNWVVSALIKVKGKANFKRESGNLFIAKITGIKCYTAKITYISNDRLGIKVYKCSGALEKDGELYRVDD